MSKIRGISATVGCAGHGLSIANGLALGLQLDKKPRKIYVLVGDGELQNGQFWEALLTTSHHKLNNICLIIDANNIQADDHLGGIKNIQPIQDKLISFGWIIQKIIDGHSCGELQRRFYSLIKEPPLSPICFIVPTIKGKGVPFAENKSTYHAHALSDEEMAIALESLRKELSQINDTIENESA